MRKKFTLLLAVVLSYTFTLSANETGTDFEEMFPGYNLSPDPDCNLDPLEISTGWQTRARIDYTEAPDGITGDYCGSVRIPYSDGVNGSYDQHFQLGVAGSKYRVRARIYLIEDESNGKIGFFGLTGSDKIIYDFSQSNIIVNVWQQLDTTVVITSDAKTDGSNGGIFFNSTSLYLDDVEVYEVPDIELLSTLVTTGEAEYNSSAIDAAALRAALDEATPVLILDEEPQNVNKVKEVISKLKAALWAYRFANASPSNPVDVTGLITNPTFDSNHNGWTSTTGAQNNTTKAVTEGTDGSGKMWENWNSTPVEGKMYQKVTGLPNGKYTLKAAAFTNYADGIASTTTYLYGNLAKTLITTYGEGELLFHTVENCIVTDGTLEIGLEVSATNWAGIDEVTLEYLGFDSDAVKQALQEQVDKVTLDYVGKVMNAVIAQNLNTAIEEAKSVIAKDSPTKQELDEVAVNLSEAANKAATSISDYNALLSFLEEMDARKENYTSFPGYAALNSLFEEVVNGHANGIYTAEEIAAVKEKLNAAEKACIASQEAPFDFTIALKNPSFEEGTYTFTHAGGGNRNCPNSWNIALVAGWVDAVKNSTNPAEGTYCYNIWSGSLESITLYQEITSLPAGKYTISAAVRTQYDYVTDQHVYAQVGDKEVQKSETFTFNEDDYEWNSLENWKYLTATFTVESKKDTVRFGVASTGDGTNQGGWFQVDDFKLTVIEKMDEPSSGIDGNNADADVKVYTVADGVKVETANAKAVNVYSVTGQLIYSGIVNGDKIISLNSGIYIVSVNNKAYKVVL